MEEIKRIDIKEFREKGYLQEVNRRLLHPLGLALEVAIDPITKEEKVNGIWDYRNDPEGLIYDLKNSDEVRVNTFENKKNFIDEELKTRFEKRIEILGFDIEPIN